ncbi:GNAT family N-acetyltransferase [Aliiglaciecola sp. 2_MG-2023]|uniref:GNAT family N-acetyltransferase n=1 Tax=unclassified Aliiglaciecola TaxID=2593648 RepID=UPI0026E1C456|nr:MULTISPECIES: GNAT family N-acetyltransferase [unclassified Aliiglaciecola]MDO6709159.1 GNAT family N-acetyltransferase [Aliiglaciecola sp. 2_MG-2023]MDO6750307.1 GNAT family N-acetyltransferase [Aliiglaciecola sp. 1_MG-2023]
MSNTAQDINPLDKIKAVYLAAEDLKIAASILYQAYHDDPLFLDIFDSEKEGYESRLRGAIREELNAFWTAKQPMIGLFEDERLLAVACMIKPDSAFNPDRFWHWRLKMLLTAGYIGTKQMIEKEQRVRERIPHEKYHMLSFIGVHPDHQHRGLGHVLMSAIDSIVLEEEKSEGVGVYVTLPKCLSFFSDGKYDHIDELKVSRITGQIMFRPRSE